jgi:tetratricopeptide (TPR) repeat protein
VADPNEQSKRDEEAPEPGSATTSERASSSEEGTSVEEGTSAEDSPADPSEASGAEGQTDAQNRAARRAAKKRAQAEGETGEIRDRNKRIREEAAAKRRAKREAEERGAPARNLDASEIVDDALVRTTHVLGNWVKRHANTIQWIVVVGIVVGLAYQIYKYRHGLTVDKATEEIVRGLRAQSGRVGPSENPAPDRYSGLLDTRQEFATEEARLKAAEAEYRKAEAATSGAASALATLGLAGVLYDQGKFKDAQAAYEKVKASELATKDSDARGRAIEGIGLSLEAQGKIDAALQAFRELSNSDVAGLNDLGNYHQGRLLVAKGERDKAKDILKKLVEKQAKADEKEKEAGSGPGYLATQARELLASVDPSSVPKPPAAGGLTPEQIERLKAQLKMQGPGSGKLDASKLEDVLKQLSVPSGAPAPAPVAPAAPGSAP